MDKMKKIEVILQSNFDCKYLISLEPFEGNILLMPIVYHLEINKF